MVKNAPNKPHRRHLFSAVPSFRYHRRIGLMGGSFNPAHDGHLYIAEQARVAAGLDEVWWLVSPQNPLKTSDGMAKFEDRLDYARMLAQPRWLRVLDFERRHHTTKTADTLRKLGQLFAHPQFFWIMGADNLEQFSAWDRAAVIAGTVPILVMNRPGYTYRALGSAGAALLGHKRRIMSPRRLGCEKHPVRHGRQKYGWSFIHQTRNPLSATLLRAGAR